jgi:hypothetical protein
MRTNRYNQSLHHWLLIATAASFGKSGAGGGMIGRAMRLATGSDLLVAGIGEDGGRIEWTPVKT